jgi:hypothetical protein
MRMRALERLAISASVLLLGLLGLLSLLAACSKKSEDAPIAAASTSASASPLPVASVGPASAESASASPSASVSASASASPSPSASASASTSASASASAAPVPSFKSFPGTEAGAKLLLAELMKPNADTAALSKQLRPTAADYKAIFDPAAAAKIDSVYSREWDVGSFVVAPRPGQTELKLASATLAELKAGTGNAKEFPSGYKKMASRITGSATVYRFRFVEPGKEQGSSYDGLMHLNGHWVLIPKPWRGLDDH